MPPRKFLRVKICHPESLDFLGLWKNEAIRKGYLLYLMLGANFNWCWISTVRCQVYNIHPPTSRLGGHLRNRNPFFIFLILMPLKLILHIQNENWKLCQNCHFPFNPFKGIREIQVSNHFLKQFYSQNKQTMIFTIMDTFLVEPNLLL